MTQLNFLHPQFLKNHFSRRLGFLCLMICLSLNLNSQISCPTLDGIYDKLDDLIITTYHGHIAKADGAFITWGEDMSSDGTDATVMTPIDPDNGYNYTGNLLMYAVSGNQDGQAFVLTTEGLWTWGSRAEVLGSPLATSNSFSSVALPPGVTGATVLDIKANSDVFFLVTNSGEVWVTGLIVTQVSGDGSTTANTWHQVKETGGSNNLTGVVELTGNREVVYARKGDGTMWTWGRGVALANGAAAQNLTYATQMDLSAIPSGVNIISIGTYMDNTANSSGVLVLGDDGKVYGVGYDGEGELITNTGNWVDDWTVLKDDSGNDITDIVFLTTSDNSEEYASAAIITTVPAANNKLWTWGDSNTGGIGHSEGLVDEPTIPDGFSIGSDNPVYTALGGHATSFLNSNNGGSICFVGHIINGSGAGLQTQENQFECFNADYTSWPEGILLCGQNAPPVAVDDQVIVTIDVATEIDVLDIGTADSDAESDITITGIGSTSSLGNTSTTQGGTISINNNGTPSDPTDDFIDYTPPAGFLGEDTFFYEVTDDIGFTDIAEVTITVVPPPAPPVAVDDAMTGGPGTSIIIDVLDNDSDINLDLDPSTVTTTGVIQPANGTITNINITTGEITYISNGGFLGTDQFEYIICDQTSPTPLCATATVTVTVANCVATGSQKIIGGTVFNDVNSNGTNDAEAGVQSVDVKIYNDVDQSGTVNTGDGLLSTETTDGSGNYSYTVVPVNVTVSDDFSSGNFSGGTGWVGGWSTSGSPSVTGGRVFCNGGSDRSFTRTVDLSSYSSGSYTVTWTMDWECDDSSSGFESGDDTFFEVSYGGGAFITLQTVAAPCGEDETNPGSVTLALTGGDANTQIRIRTSNNSESEDMYFDNVSINITGDPTHFVIETDGATYPVYFNLTTDNIETAQILTPGNCDSGNDFGLKTNITATDDNESMEVGTTSVTIDVTNNDIGNPATPTIETQPTGGTATVDGSGNIIFTPDDDTVEATYTFTYEVCSADDSNVCDIATVTVNVNTNEPPVAVDNNALTDENTDVVIDVLANDSDVDGNMDATSVSTTGVLQPSNGTTSINPTTGEITYSPSNGFTGTDQFEYIVCDTENACDTASVTIGVGELLLAVDDNASTNINTAFDISVLDNDLLSSGVIDLTSMNFGAITPSNGTVTFNPDGTVNYNPALDFVGQDTFEYNVCTEPTTGNLTNTFASTNVPVAISDGGANTVTSTLTIPGGSGGSIIDVNLINLNITHTYISDLVISLESPASTPVTLIDEICGSQNNIIVGFDDEAGNSYGSLPCPPTNGNAYQPNGSLSDFDGENSAGTWTLTVDDLYNEDGGSINSWELEITYLSTVAGVCDIATVVVTVVGPPVANNDEKLDQTPGDVTLNTLTNDLAEDGLVPTAGEVTVDLDLTQSGVQTSLNVSGEGDWTYNASNGEITFSPQGGYTGDPTDITYELTETATGLTDQATVNIEYNGPPVANNDEKLDQTPGDVTLNALTNDLAEDGLVPTAGEVTVDLDLTQSGVQTSLNVSGEGDWTYNASNGEITFSPQGGFAGDPTDITYELTEIATGLTDQATVNIEYNGPPVANNDEALNQIPGDVTLNALTNDLAEDGMTPTAGEVTVDLDLTTAGVQTSLNVSGEGDWTYNVSNGEITFSPQGGFAGNPTDITYELVETATGLTDQATVNIEYDYPPVATNDANTYTPGSASDPLNVTINDTSGDAVVASTVEFTTTGSGGVLSNGNKTLTVSGQGEWTVNASGEAVFTPEVSYTGSPTPPTYTVEDAEGNVSNEATITLTADPLPVATNDTDSYTSGSASDPLDILSNDTSGDAVVATTVTLETTGLPVGSSCTTTGADGDCIEMTVPNEGVWTVNETTGALIFSPSGIFNGSPSVITYSVEDAEGNSVSATVTLTVDPVANNDESLLQPAGIVNLNILTNDLLEDGMTPTAGEVTVDLDLTTSGIQNTLVVANEGTWTYTSGSGNLEFVPSGSLNGNPTDIVYELTEIATGLTNQATVNIEYVNGTEATNDFTNTPFNTQVTSSVLTNDRDLEGNTQSVTTFKVDTNGDGIPNATKSIGASTIVAGKNKGGTANVNAGTLTQSANGSYIFIPTSGFVGTVTYEYTVCDDVTPQACGIAIAKIKVLPESNTSNTDVTASPDAYFTEEDITVTSTVFSNDNDPEGGTFDVTSGMIDTNGDGVANANLTIGTSTTIAGIDENGSPVLNAGSLQINVNGTFTFVPTSGFTGTVTAEYDITDSDGDTDNAPLVIEIIADVGNEIFATDDSALTDAETPVSGNLTTNDVDPEGDIFNITGLNIDTDGDGLTDTPVLSGDIDGSTPITIGGTDSDGDPVANAGTLVIAADGTYTFTPSVGFAGNVNVCYLICDNPAGAPAPPIACDPATLEISVLEVYRDYGDAPVAYPIAWHRAMIDNDSNNEFDGSNDVWLGSKSSFEGSQPSSPVADGDTFDDAISFGNGSGQFPTSIAPNSSYSVDLTVNSASPNTVYYGMWIDWDEDGTYDSLYVGSQVTASPATTSITVNSSAIYTGETVNIRIRVDDEPLVFADFEGGKTNGEVEDFQAFVALPVELSSFEGRENGCDVQLTWKTQSEENFDYFEVEWSGDGHEFRAIEKIEGKGGTTMSAYFFKDMQASELNYYRLRMVDLDETVEYSKTISVETDCADNNGELVVYPNPILRDHGLLNVEFFTKKGETQLLIVDLLGRTVKRISFDVEPEMINYIQIDISNLPAGTYSLQQVGTVKSNLFIIQE